MAPDRDAVMWERKRRNGYKQPATLACCRMAAQTRSARSPCVKRRSTPLSSVTHADLSAAPALAAIAHLIENGERWIRQRHYMILAHFHALAWNAPGRQRAVDFRPVRLNGFVGPASGEDHKAKHRSSGATRGGECDHEPRRISVGQGRVVTYDALRPFGKFLSELFGQLGRIAKILVVDVNILRDDCFDPPRTRFAVSRLSIQIGASSWKMWLGRISAIVRLPIVG